MCGIAGLIDYRSRSNKNILKDMTDSLQHRGPDDSGYLFKKDDSTQIGLGHRRLSILDLSKNGHQPMIFQELSIIYNGEVYNFKEIRDELEKCGYQFHSNSDTEVVLKAYHKWGTKMVDRLNGMYAIAILDSINNTLTLIRDRAGVKPLYWYHNNELFLFASELKSFHEHPDFKKKLDHAGLVLFLQYGYIPEPYSIFENTHKVKAGHFLIFDIDKNELKVHKYWDVIDYYEMPKLDISEQEAEEETEKLLKSSFEYRMISDVPVGVFLSGGYDSSIVTALLQTDRTDKLKTFTIGFHEDKYNEANHAKRVAEYLGTDHTEYYCTQKDALDILPNLSEIWDEPFADPSVIPTTLVSKLARRDVTVSLSADGGDEVFGGYDKYTGIGRKLKNSYLIPKLIRPLIKKLLVSTFALEVSEVFRMSNAEFRLNRYSDLLGLNEKEMLKEGSKFYLESDLERIALINYVSRETNFDTKINREWLDNVMAIDYKTYQLDNILVKVDRATMSVGLEGREPLLDYRIVEFVSRLEKSFKINGGVKKRLLRKITHKYIPKELMERPKMGFSVPIFNWFKDELREYLMYFLSREKLTETGIFNVDEVIILRDNYLKGGNINIHQLWNILVFEIWREKWM